jgi:muramoyltetrapeptide carboxypeptidase
VEFSKPPALRPGDTVRIVAPAGAFERDAFEAGLEYIARRYKPVYDPGVFAKTRYLAGDDSHRLAQLEQAFEDPKARAVFSARGGYGAMRLLPRLNLRGWPLKALIGFSDVTALHSVFQREGRVSIHAPVVTQLAQVPAAHVERLFEMLESPAPAAPLSGARPLVSGTAEGTLLGGNLSVFTRLLGTPYLPSLDGAVLLVEDVGERPYRLDRMWTHLKLSGALDRLSGLALGEFTGCEEKDAGYSSFDVLEGLARETGVPCAHGFPIGHGIHNAAVALGTRVRLDATSGTLDFLEGAVGG